MYFTHGSTMGGAGGFPETTTAIRSDAGPSNLDFGQGFYAFNLDDPRSFGTSAEWARRKQLDQLNEQQINGGIDPGVSFVLIVSISSADYRSLSKIDYGNGNTPDYITYVNTNRNQQLDLHPNFDVVSGPIAKQAQPDVWRANTADYPIQYTFKTPRAVSKLKPVALIPV